QAIQLSPWLPHRAAAVHATPRSRERSRARASPDAGDPARSESAVSSCTASDGSKSETNLESRFRPHERGRSDALALRVCHTCLDVRSCRGSASRLLNGAAAMTYD